MYQVEFEPATPAFERTKIVYVFSARPLWSTSDLFGNRIYWPLKSTKSDYALQIAMSYKLLVSVKGLQQSGIGTQRRTFRFPWVPELSHCLSYSNSRLNYPFPLNYLKRRSLSLSCYDRRSVSLGVRHTSGIHDQICITLTHLWVCWSVATLWREANCSVHNFYWSFNSEAIFGPIPT
jgi:hypothetical protein